MLVRNHLHYIYSLRDIECGVADYREAKRIVKECRNRPNLPAGTSFRMMFAQDVGQAERLLTEKREARPMGEHD